MNERLKNLYRKYLLQYINKINPVPTKITEKTIILCPHNCQKEACAQVNNNKVSCYNPDCKKETDIFDYVKLKKPLFADKSSEDVAGYIAHFLKITVEDDTQDLLERYSDAGFTLIPITQGHDDPRFNKMPPRGFKWTEQGSKNIKIWNDWIARGWGLALVLGEKSGVDAIDIDDLDTLEKVKHLLGDTLIQDTSRGFHYLYKYDSDLKKTLNKVLRDAGYEMEYRTDGAYIVIAPSTTQGEIRKWNDKKILDMPNELKDFLLQYYEQGVKESTYDEVVQDCIDNEKLDVVDLSGKRNDTFIKLAGIFSKKLNMDQNRFVLEVISNNLIDTPIARRELFAMLEQIKKYKTYDKEELAKIILERLEVIQEGTAFQIASSLKYEQTDVEDVLKYLEDQGKVLNIGNRKYQIVNHVEWTTETDDLSVPVDFEVPYFHDYAYFDWGNMIIIGGASGTGKTHLVGNIIKKLVDQGVKPYLVNTEAGSKIGKITDTLGVPPHSYWLPKKPIKHPTDIELVDNAVTIIDWLKPKDGDYAKTDNTFEHLHHQLKKHGGFLIVMTQIRNSNKEFFAQDQIEFYGALVAKYLFGDGGKDSENTYFKIQKIRDGKKPTQYIDIPMYFDRETKFLEKR